MKKARVVLTFYAITLGIPITGALADNYAPVMSTGQTGCYDAAGALISCAGSNQDGETRAGIPQMVDSARFQDQGDGTIIDKQTGLMWLKDTTCLGNHVWIDELWGVWMLNIGRLSCQDYTANYMDWRMPNINELNSLHNLDVYSNSYMSDRGFANLSSSNIYWSSTTDTFDMDEVFIFDTQGVSTMTLLTHTYTKSIWDPWNFPPLVKNTYSLAVRRYQPEAQSIAPVAKTGRTSYLYTLDDGDSRRGVASPSPRFVDNGDGTVKDMLTGLTWAQDSRTPGPAACTSGSTKSWSDVSAYIDCLNSNAFLGYSDWRWPNISELKSLHDYEQGNLPADHPFIGVPQVNTSSSDCYMSSTTAHPETYDYRTHCFGEIPWTIAFQAHRKVSIPGVIWPVRSGSWLEESNANIYYLDGSPNGWAVVQDEIYSGGTSTVSGVWSVAEALFNGTGIRWITAKGPDQAVVLVYIDDQFHDVVDLYSSDVEGWHVLEYKDLPQGEHTITLYASEKNPASTDYNMTVDAFQVIP